MTRILVKRSIFLKKNRNISDEEDEENEDGEITSPPKPSTSTVESNKPKICINIRPKQTGDTQKVKMKEEKRSSDRRQKNREKSNQEDRNKEKDRPLDKREERNKPKYHKPEALIAQSNAEKDTGENPEEPQAELAPPIQDTADNILR